MSQVLEQSCEQARLVIESHEYVNAITLVLHLSLCANVENKGVIIVYYFLVFLQCW